MRKNVLGQFDGEKFTRTEKHSIENVKDDY